MEAFTAVMVGSPQGEGVTVGESGGDTEPTRSAVRVRDWEGVREGEREEDMVREAQGEGVQVAGVTVMVLPMW